MVKQACQPRGWGTLFADFIAVAGDLSRVTSRPHARFVMKGAAVVRNEIVEK